MEKAAATNWKQFQKKVWISVAITAFVLISLLLLKAIFSVLLLVLAAALIALYFRRLAGLLERKLRVPGKLSLPLAILVTLLLWALFFWLAGNRISTQAKELSKTIPSMVENVKQRIDSSSIGQQVIEKISGDGQMKQAGSFIQGFFRSSFGVLGDVYVVLFLSLFFTASPKLYTGGMIKLLPVQARKAGAGILDKLGNTLAKWLKGQLFAMLVVAVLTLIGLLLMGVPMAFTLAVIAGLLNFIPNFGPLIAMVPAVMVALMQGPTTALLVAGLYILVQVIESNFITPQVQKRLIELPPALIIIAQLLMGVLTGGWGLLLATPLMAILMILVQELWVKKQDAKEQAV